MSSAAEIVKRIVVSVLLIDDAEYVDDHGPAQFETWDSLATVTISTRIADQLNIGFEPEEIVSIASIGDIKQLCRAKGLDL